MDVNVVFECIGYGATRAISSVDFPRIGSRVPARFILETAKDPVGYCIEAYQRQFPNMIVDVDMESRRMILTRLRREAGVTEH